MPAPRPVPPEHLSGLEKARWVRAHSKQLTGALARDVRFKHLANTGLVKTGPASLVLAMPSFQSAVAVCGRYEPRHVNLHHPRAARRRP